MMTWTVPVLLLLCSGWRHSLASTYDHVGEFDEYYHDGYLSDFNADWAMLGGRINQPKCIDIPSNLTLCRDIGYTQMRLPNLLDHDSVREVTQQAVSWVPLLGIRCHPDTKLFLCSLFSPVCLDRPIWPCRTLCNDVRTGCEARMAKYGYPWPEMLRCDKFPLDNDLCIGLQNHNKPDDSVCAACNHPETFETIIDNYCSAEFVIKLRIKDHVISEGDIKIAAQKKRKLYKKGGLKKKDIRDIMVYIDGGARCECGLLDEVQSKDSVLVMGHKRAEKMVVSFMQIFDSKSKVMKQAMRAMRRGDICDNGVQSLTETAEAHTESNAPAPEVVTEGRDRKGNGNKKDRKKKGDRRRDRGERPKKQRPGREERPERGERPVREGRREREERRNRRKNKEQQ